MKIGIDLGGTKTEGILIGRTHKALVYPGDFLALVAKEIK